ncbi:MAG: hypothetical protein SVS85_01000, partial [Candidatus Nanohaloarchaea archaeon]|nr:hypothetical protein [Candidatus Nanohaloarchaea archaeon]
MKSSGQAINIDHSIGLGLFLISVLSGMLLTANAHIGNTNVANARQQASLAQQELEEEVFHRGGQSPLIVSTPAETGRIPVDREYIFPEKAYPGSGSMDVPADIRIGEQRVITVIKGANRSHRLNYFYSNTTNLSYSNMIQTGSWMNNTKISVKPGSPGLQSLKVAGNEVLNPAADLNGNSFSITEEELHARTLSGDLKLYNGSRELILENPGTVTFDMKNFTTLYWHADGSTTTLSGTGTFKSGNTTGFTVASSYGVTFLGDELDATVSKPDSSTVRATIDSPRLRIYLHNSDYQEGKDRIQFFDRGTLVFGAAKKMRGASIKKTKDLGELPDRKFENRLGLGDFNYNIRFGPMLEEAVATLKDWNTGSHSKTSAARKDSSGTLGLGYRNGTAGDSLAGYYRFDTTS